MGKQVTIIASGETERRALPHLVSHLRSQGIYVTEVRIPPRNRALNVGMAESLIRAAWHSGLGSPDKFVVLVDTDGKSPEETLAPFQNLPGRLHGVGATTLFAYSQWHLEAWYFADAANLRTYFRGRALGSVDTSRPDEIENPKLHLKNLLDNRVYTALVSEEIARTLDARTIAQRSPSFQGFMDAVMNGNLTKDTGSA